MNSTLHLLHLGVKELNQGVCVVWRCPRCTVARDFQLIQSKGNITFLGLEFSKPAILLDLRCSGCRYEVRVDPSEASLLAQAAEATRFLKEGSISADTYQDGLLKLAARFISTLRALNECWKCSGCSEDNPVTFDSCWKCGRKSSANAGDRVASDQSPIQLPKSGNPWEFS